MTLKAELREAILTGGAEGAAPTQKTIVLTSGGVTQTSWGTIATAIAPYTGIAYFNATAASDTAVAVIDNGAGRNPGMRWVFSGSKFSISTVCRKGDTVTVNGSDFTDWAIKFQKIVGGGVVNPYLRQFSILPGGQVCRLKLTSENSEKRVRERACHKTPQHKSFMRLPAQALQTGSISPRLATVTPMRSPNPYLSLGSMFLTGVPESGGCTITHKPQTIQGGFRLRKATLSRSTCSLRARSNSYFCLHTQPANNSLKEAVA